ncbi:MAG: hypothetical protein AAGD25_09565 [Cyanobacteria bacterium P01_F01_bin.150]
MAKLSHSVSLSQTSLPGSTRHVSTQKKSVFSVSSRTIAIAGTATSLATFGVMHMGQASSYYEGSIQLVSILPPHSSVPAAGENIKDTVPQPLDSLSDQMSNIAPPDLIHAIDTQIINNQAMVDAVGQRLSQQGISINHAKLLTHLSAQATPQGWLEIRYADSDSIRVQAVLEEVAQWYASQDSKCEIQACDDVAFIESQIPILTQRQQQLAEELVAVEKTIYQQTGLTGASTELKGPTQELLVEQHEQIQQIAQIKTRVNELSQKLAQYQAQMQLSDFQAENGMALQRLIPKYDAWLAMWKEGDRQLLNSSAPQLSDHQQQIHNEMKQTIHDLLHQPNQRPAIIRRLLLVDEARFEPIRKWLFTLHEQQLLETRRHTLEEMHQDTVAKIQKWQEAMAIRSQLKRELDIVEGTLSAYQEKLISAQHQAAKETLTWQVISPPEIVYQPKEWVRRSWANALQQSRRLVTLQ